MTNQDLNGFPNSIMRLTDVDSDGKYNSMGASDDTLGILSPQRPRHPLPQRAGGPPRVPDAE